MRSIIAALVTITLFASAYESYAAESLVGFTKDELAPDEAGLWMVVERQEQDIRTSSILVDDPELNQLISTITCDLVGESCSYLRPYIIRAPGFNAFMMPNGAFFIQSGLLLRVSDASELAAVIGHEASHYFRNHTIDRFRAVNKTGNTFAVLGALVSAASSVSINSASTYESLSRNLNLSNTAVAMLQTAQIVAALQLLDYSRDQESEADIDGVSWMAGTSYNPMSSIDLWQGVIDEQEAGGDSAGFSILATHPAPEARIQALRDKVVSLAISERNSEDLNLRLNVLVNRHRDEWLTEEMQALSPEQFEFLLRRQVSKGYPSYRGDYLVGLRFLDAGSNSSSSKERSKYFNSATAAFTRGIESAGLDAQPEMFRDLGKAYESLGMDSEAKSAYSRYLEILPDAWDARFIKRKL